MGVKNSKNPDIRYEQTRNSIEEIVRKIMQELVREGKLDAKDARYLESCGACAFSTIMEGMGFLQSKDYFSFPAGEQIQMDDAAMVWMNDPKRNIYQATMANRYADTYVKAARELYDCSAYIHSNTTFKDVTRQVSAGNGVQICLKNPGHWLAVIDYDGKRDVLIYMDSWGGRPGLKNGGVFEEMDQKEFTANAQPDVIVYRSGT
jgi:hypothetical protein